MKTAPITRISLLGVALALGSNSSVANAASPTQARSLTLTPVEGHIADNARLAFCGDGLPDPGEECDDGNNISGDGCSAACEIESSEPPDCVAPPPTSSNILVDGSFEDFNIGGEWTVIEHSLFGSLVLCGPSCFDRPFAAAPDGSLTSGNYVIIAGGTFSESSTGIVRHAPVAIPAQATTLEFQWATLASGPPGQACAGATDGIWLSIDGVQVWSSLDNGPCFNVNPYQRIVIDLANAPGGPYQGRTVEFEFNASATGIPPSVDLTTIFLDDVSINVPVDPLPPDCDGDSVEDALDNCTYTVNPDQRDTDNDGHGNRCDADLNQDCQVAAADLALLKSTFFSADPDADFDGDGVVNVVDLAIMKSLFFAAPGPSAAGALCNP